MSITIYFCDIYLQHPTKNTSPVPYPNSLAFIFKIVIKYNIIYVGVENYCGGGNMFNRAELKQQAKDQLRGRWGGTIGAFVLVYIVMCAVSSLSLIFYGPLMVGLIIYCMSLIKSYDNVDIGTAFRGFNIFGPALATYLWEMLWVFLWSLLFIIPGIIKGYSYSQCLYIIADNPNIGASQALKISMHMTKGYKWKIFVMQLSFLGWSLLCILSLFIGYLWLVPYMQLTMTNMYYKLKDLSLESGACAPGDFGMA